MGHTFYLIKFILIPLVFAAQNIHEEKTWHHHPRNIRSITYEGSPRDSQSLIDLVDHELEALSQLFLYLLGISPVGQYLASLYFCSGCIGVGTAVGISGSSLIAPILFGAGAGASMVGSSGFAGRCPATECRVLVNGRNKCCRRIRSGRRLVCPRSC